MNSRLDLLKTELSAADTHEAADIGRVIKMVNTALNTDPEERKIYMRKKIFSAGLAAAIIMIITSLTALGAAFDWHEKLIEIFRPTTEQMRNLNGNVDAPQASASDNGITVNVLNTLADSRNIYVLYEAILPENVQITQDMLDKHLTWIREGLCVSAEEPDNGVMGIGGESSKIISFSENKMQIIIRSSWNENLSKNQKVELYMTDLGYYETIGDEVTEHIVAECDISVSWNFNYEDNSKQYVIGKPVNIADGRNCVLLNIEISPLSVWWHIEGDDVLMAAKPVINFRDGSSIRLSARNDFNTTYNFANFLDRKGGVTTIGYRFERITDLSEIESIEIGDYKLIVE